MCYDSVPSDRFLESIFEFSYLLIWGLMMGSSPNLVIFSTFTIEIYHYIVHYASTPYDKYLESIFEFSHMSIRGLIKG